MKYFRLASWLLLSLIMLQSCGSGSVQKQESNKIVKTEVVEATGNRLTFSYPGKIVSRKEVGLSFRIAGPIAKINVVAGQAVKKNQVLAVMDQRDYEIQLSATEAEYNQIKAEAGRVIELYNRGSATQNDYDKAVYGLQRITAKYEAHKNALADTRLTAPFDGFVQTIMREASETIGAGMQVLTMISSGMPQVEINISAADYLLKDKFLNYYCTTNEFEGTVFPLEMVNITKQANLNQLYLATFNLKPVDGITPAPGVSTTVYIVYTRDGDVFTTAPITALFEEEGRSFVWVVDKDNKISRRQVYPAEFKKDGKVIISSGLKDGETIITAGVHSVKEGDTVKPLARPSESNVGGLI